MNKMHVVDEEIEQEDEEEKIPLDMKLTNCQN